MTKKTLISKPEDAELFRNSLGDVKTLQTNTLHLSTAPKPKPYPQRNLHELRHNPLQNPVHDDLETLYQEDTMSFLGPGLQKSVLKKLRKGHYGIDADIDLHGMTSRDALKRLLVFLEYCQQNGFRCIQIIHGKGYNSPDNQPVLKNELNLWLRKHQNVRAFCSTPQRAGGAGAIYVLLALSDKYGDDDALDFV